MWHTPFQPMIIAVLVVLEVAVWQVRVALATRGRKQSAAVLGAVNAVLSVAAIGQVVTNLDRLENIAGYALGVSVGVYVGVIADTRFAGDPVEYRIVLPGNGHSPADELLARGWSVTSQAAHGLSPATVLTAVVDSKWTREFERDLDRLAPEGLRTSIRLRSATWPRPSAERLGSVGNPRSLRNAAQRSAANTASETDRADRTLALDAQAAGGSHRFAARSDRQFGQDRRHVMVGCLTGDDKARSDISIAQTFGEQNQHTELAGRQPGRIGPGPR